MIVTREWLNEWIDLRDVSSEDICEKLNSIGLEVDSLTKQEVPSGVVVGKVVECEKHLDADKLNVTKVDIGSETLQIVCGAKNVAKGQFVAVATIGTVLGEGFKIKKAKLRGVESSGMICSSSEIGLVKTNDGIMELDDSIGALELGKELRKYPLLNDDIIEIELTANRGDCLSIRGVARDLCAVYDKELKSKELLIAEDRRGIGRVLELDTKSKVDCSLKYMFFEKDNLRCDFLTNFRLYMIEKLTNNDVQNSVNYIAYESGVILRAYDFDKFKSDENGRATLVLKKDEDGVDRVYNEENIVSEVGLNQNKEFDVDENSKNILVEASFIKPEVVSMARFKHNLKTDELYYNSSRGSESDLKLGLDLLSDKISSKAIVYGGYDETIDDFEEEIIQVRSDFINKFIGQNVDESEVISTLQKLGFEVDFKEEFFVVKVPLFRSDIKNSQDIVEEIVRIVGIDNIESKPLALSERVILNSSYEKIKKRRYYKNKAVGRGYFEQVSYIFDNKDEMRELGFEVVDDEIVNPITAELSTLRTTLSLNLLRSASLNVKSGKKEPKLFELGITFKKDLTEVERFGFVRSGEVGFSDVASDLFAIVGECELRSKTPNNKLFNPYEYASIMIDGKEVGFLARVHVEIEKKYDLKNSYICEVDFDALRWGVVTAHEYSKFQSSSKDLSFLTPKEMKFEVIDEVLKEADIKNVVSYHVADIYHDDSLGDNYSLTIRFTLQKMDSTLSEDEIKEAIESLQSLLKEKLGLELR